MEHGTKPELSVCEDGTIVFPCIQTGNSGVDTMIRKAWLGEYTSTAQMLEHAYSLHATDGRCLMDSMKQIASRQLLRDRVKLWRENRKERFGTERSISALFFSTWLT
jgi:hypothetical protein